MGSPSFRGSVVVGVDGSDDSDRALTWAVDYAAARHTPLCILHGAGDLGGPQLPFRADAREMLGGASRRITDHALKLVERAAPDLDVTVRSPFEDARAALLDVQDAVMVVVGSRGRGPVRSLLLGSVSLALVSYAHEPVTVVRATDDTGERDSVAEVVVGVDVDGSSQGALDVALDLASTSGWPLVALHVWSAHDTFIDSMSYQQRLDVMDRHQRLFSEAMAGFKERYPDVLVTEQLVDGSAVEALVQASKRARHLVLGSRPHHRLPGYFGSVGRSVVEHAHCPVTVARPAPDDERAAEAAS